jgi:hypothetical protein
VAFEDRQVTDVDVDAKRVVVVAGKALDRVHDADSTTGDAVAVAPVAAAVGVVSVSRATKRTNKRLTSH